MKFAIFVVMLALVGVQSSVLPLWAPQSYTAVHGPAVYATAPWVQPLTYAHAPIVHAPIVHAPIVHAPIVLAPAEGTYVAQTRGAVHVAPLPGHLNSAASINLEPAPGTL